MFKLKYFLTFIVALVGVFFMSTNDAKALGCGSSYGSTYTGLDYATTMTTGQSRTIGVGFTNCGTNTWTAAGSYFLGTIDPENNMTWGLNRVSVGGDVAPGVNKVFWFGITAPSTPGTYVLRFMMVREGVVWFGDATPYVTVTVTAPVLPPSCTSAGPEGAVEAYGTTLHNVYAYGVANSSSVLFPARRIGVDADWVWWPGTNLGGGTWLGTIPTPSTFSGAVWVHVYLNGTVFCGSANYTISAPAAPTVSIAAYQSTIPYNTSAGIYWSSSGAVTSCLVSPIGSTATSMPSPGHPYGPLTSTTTFTITCTGPGGSTSASTTVTVSAAPQPACSSAGPDGTVEPYGTIWHTAYAYGIYNSTSVLFPAYRTGVDSAWIWWPGSQVNGDTWSANIPTDSNYAGDVLVHVYLYNAYVSDVFCDSANYTVASPAAPTVTIAAYQPTIPYGGSTGIYWSSSGSVTSCSTSPLGSTALGMPSPGHPTGVLYTNTTYTTTCTGPGGTTSQSATVYVGPPPPHASCSSVTVANAEVPYNLTSLAVTVQSVSDATKVKFPTWSAENGQDDIIWYEDTSASGGWTVNVNPSSHSGLGTVYTDVYAISDAYPSENVYCGGITFIKKKLGVIQINTDGSYSWTLSGPGCTFRSADCSGTGSKSISDMMYGTYTVTPQAVQGYSASVTPSSTIELKD
jgi:hypothetical protein